MFDDNTSSTWVNWNMSEQMLFENYLNHLWLLVSNFGYCGWLSMLFFNCVHMRSLHENISRCLVYFYISHWFIYSLCRVVHQFPFFFVVKKIFRKQQLTLWIKDVFLYMYYLKMYFFVNKIVMVCKSLFTNLWTLV